MPGKSSYRKRVFFLGAGAVLALILSYTLAISETVKVRRELIAMQENLSKVSSAPRTISLLERKTTELDLKIGSVNNGYPDFQKGLLDEVSRYCSAHSLILRDFPQVHSFKTQDYEFITGYAKVEGSFIPLVQLLYNLERKSESGRICSVDFNCLEDRKAKKLRLTMSFYIQIVKHPENDQNDRR
jgi:hypothetical protein